MTIGDMLCLLYCLCGAFKGLKVWTPRGLIKEIGGCYGQSTIEKRVAGKRTDAV